MGAIAFEVYYMLKITEEFLNNNNLQQTEDIDSLLDLADLVRQLIDEKCCCDICHVICYTVKNGFYEAFSWIMGLLQEELEKDSGLDDFECDLGKSIPDYDGFIQNLQVELNALNNDVETISDENGEVQSFFNIFTYKTGFKNIYLISLENFDTKDNDFIKYKLSFERKGRI